MNLELSACGGGGGGDERGKKQTKLKQINKNENEKNFMFQKTI